MPFERGKVVITLHFRQHNPYTHYYLEQQDRGMSVFRSSPWQMGHGQKGYGLGALFRTVARTTMPLVKRGAKALGNILLNTGVNFASDVVTGKNVKQAAKARALEGVNTAKTKAVQRLQRYAQTGQGRKRSRSSARKRRASASASRRSSRKRKASRTKRRAKKRKASPSVTRRKPTKRARTSPRDIFG